MTQLKMAQAGKITPQMERVAKGESLKPDYIREMVKEGKIVIPSNRLRWKQKISRKSTSHTGRVYSVKSQYQGRMVCGIGLGLSTKVNANIGTSSDYPSANEELAKLKSAVEAGTDTVMDLSTGGNIPRIRQRLLAQTLLTFGTVPIYEAAIKEGDKYRAIKEMAEDEIFRVIERHARDGVDFITVHCGVTQASLRHLEEHPRVGGIVSRGGAILAEWMRSNHKENPLYRRFNDLLEIARTYDVTLSLGDGLRPGAIADASDRAQIHELIILAGLARRAYKADVQVMIEGPGHVPLHQIQAQVQLQKELCNGAPFYVLGPIVTDIAPGYDHITSAIGGAIAAWAGADFLCYVTPMEHLGLPTPEHVREGVMAARMAAHAADIAKGIKKAWEEDKRFSEFRRNRDWTKQIKFSMDPKRAAAYRHKRRSKAKKVCSMCGEICAYKILEGGY